MARAAGPESDCDDVAVADGAGDDVGSGGVGGQGAAIPTSVPITERSTSQIADVLRLTHDEKNESAHDRRDDRLNDRIVRTIRRAGLDVLAVQTPGRCNSTEPNLPNTSGCAGVLGCGWGGGARLGLVGDLGFGGGSGGCCVGSWACVVFPGAVGCCGGCVELVADVDLVVEQDWGLTGDVGRFGPVRECLWSHQDGVWHQLDPRA